jgi:hypothetical protein
MHDFLNRAGDFFNERVFPPLFGYGFVFGVVLLVGHFVGER